MRGARAVAEALLFVGVLLYGAAIVTSRQAPPVSYADEVFRSFDLPEPSPTPIPGLHEYAVPLRPVPSPTLTPTAPPTPRPRATAAPRPTKHTDTLGGVATWHATGRDGFYAAAGPALRRAIGPNWRGSHVLVARYGTTKGVEVVLNDWCACGDRHGYSTLLDLSDEAFRALAPLSRGVIRVAVDIP